MNNSTDTSSTAPIAPRRTSIPNSLLARHHREPLAVLDPQSANSRVSDDSNRTTSSMFAYSQQQSDQKDNDHNLDLYTLPIRSQIMDQHNLSDDDVHKQAALSSSKFSTTQISSTEPLSKRENHPSSRQIPPSKQSARRASVPAIHFRSSSSSFEIDQSIHPLPENPAYISNDELYSALGSFTFGTVQSTSTPATEILDASFGRLMDQKPRRSLSSIPTARDEVIFDEADAARSNRAKMRAIDDGNRRPSLPKNPISDLPPQHNIRKRSSIDTSINRNVSLDADRSSTYTFGLPGIYNSFVRDQNRKDNDDLFDVVSSSPVVFAQSRSVSPDFDVDEDMRFAISLSNEERKGSLPVDIPALSTPSDEDSIAVRRKMSRSLGNDLRTINSGIEGMMSAVTGANSQSEPLTRGEWSSIEQQNQQKQPPDIVPEENPYEGLNLAYIFGENPMSGVPRKSWSSGGSFVQRQPEQSSSSAAQTHHFGLWFNTGPSDGRRLSSTTIHEDTFYRHLRNNDANYDARLSEWSFGKEKADGAGPRTVNVHTGASKDGTSNTVYIHEIWRCQQVGRFDVQIGTLVRYSEQDSAKPPQYRLVGKHIIDPFLKTARGGPHFMVHKHTRAMAFSIFRSHALFATPGRVDTSNSILLATKSVQEVYTSTKTTNKLKTHGLLEESWNEDNGGDRASRSQSASRGSPRASSTSRKNIEKREKEKEKEKEKKKAKEKEKGKEKHRDGSSSQTASRESVHSNAQSQNTKIDNSFVSNWTRHLSGCYASPPLNQPQPVPSSSNTAQVSSASNSSQALSIAKASAWNASRTTLDVPSRSPHRPLHQSSSRLGLRDRFEDDEDDDADIIDEYHLPVQRRTHAETYDSLTPLHHEHARRTLQSNSSSSGSRLRKIFPTRKGVHMSDWPTSSPSVAMVPSPVPWMLTNNSEKLEEGQIVMSNLNDNFGAVGLVPPRQHNRTPTRRRSARVGHDVLHRVPDNSLYMLLPLFAGDFEPAYTPKEWDPAYEVRLEDRKYLLVYYVPFDKRGNKGLVVPDSSVGQGKHKGKSVHLPSFRVSAHIMSYNDFRGSGVKLPSAGLSVMGPLSEATPPAVVPDVHTDAIAIAQCSKKENGIEFLPEGLTKLGLCDSEEIPPVFDAGSDGMESEIELKFELTSIGRAVVELAWAGAMAVSCLDA